MAQRAELDFLGPPKHPGQIGTLGPYEITEVIGRGGMGIVLKALDPRLNRFVAVKVLAPEMASNPTARQRFAREAQAAAAVSHDHVVTIHAVDESDRLPYLVMEYINGVSLHDLLKRRGALELREILRIGMQAASGLAAAHAQGLVHRDVKPANILLENGVQRVKLTDFGLARLVDDVSMTQTGVVAGTPEYMSPEQAHGEHVDHRSDLFSLGCVLYAMCTGRSPFRAETTMGVLHRVCQDDPRPIREVNPDIPDWLCAVIERLLEKNPADRFQTAEEVAELLEQCLAHVQQPHLVALPRTPKAAAWRHGRKRSPAMQRSRNARLAWFILLASAMVILLTGLIVMGVWSLRHATVAQQQAKGSLVIRVRDPEITEIRITPRDDRARRRFRGVNALDFQLNGQRELDLRNYFSPGLYQIWYRREGPAWHEDVAVRITAGQTEGVVIPLRTVERADFDDSPRAARLFTGGPIDSHYCIAVSGDGRRALTGQGSGAVCLWDIESGKLVRAMTGHEQAVQAVLFTPDGKHGLSGAEDGSIRLWDLETGQEVRRFVGHEARVETLALSPDGKRLLSGSADFLTQRPGTLRLWDLETGEEIRRFAGELGWMTEARFLPAGDRIVAVDRRVHALLLWDANTGQPIDRNHNLLPTSPLCLDVSPDGRYAVTGHAAKAQKDGQWHDPENCILRLWDLKTLRVVRQFRGHAGPVVDVRFSPDGKYVLSASSGVHDGAAKFVETDDQTVRLWDVETGRELQRYQPEERLYAIAFLPDGDSFLTGGLSTLRLWRIGWTPYVAKERARFEGHFGPCYSIEFSPDGRLAVSASGDETVRVWKVATGEQVQCFQRHQIDQQQKQKQGAWGARTAVFSPDGQRVLSGGWDGAARLWDVQTGEEILRLEGHVGLVSEVAFSSDGRLAFTANGIWRSPSDQIFIRVWDAQSGEEVRRLSGHAGAIHCIAVSPDDRYLASGGMDCILRVWDLKTGGMKWIKQLASPVHDVAFSPDGRSLVACHAAQATINGRVYDPQQGEFHLYDVESGEVVQDFRGHTGSVRSLAFSSDGRWVISASGLEHLGEGGNIVPASDNTIRVWDARDGRELCRLNSERAVHCARLSPDGRTILSCGEEPYLRLWRLPEKIVAPPRDTMHAEAPLALDEVRRFVGSHVAPLLSVAVSPDGKRVVASSSGGGVFLWETATGRFIRRFEGHTGYVRAVAFSPDGPLIASGSAAYGHNHGPGPLDNTVRLWDVETGRERRRLEGVSRPVDSLAFSSDGRRLLIGGGWLLGVWDVASGQRVRAFIRPPVNTLSVAFSPDGRRAVTGHMATEPTSFRGGKFLDPENCVVRLWDVETGRLVRILRGHTGPVNSVSFSPDGRLILSASGGHHYDGDPGYAQAYDNTLRLWDAQTGEELCRADVGTSIRSVAFTPDGHFVVSAGGELAAFGGDHKPDLRLWRLPEELFVVAGENARAPQAEAEEGDPSPPDDRAAAGELFRRFERTIQEALSVSLLYDGEMTTAQDGATDRWQYWGAYQAKPGGKRSLTRFFEGGDGSGRHTVSGLNFGGDNDFHEPLRNDFSIGQVTRNGFYAEALGRFRFDDRGQRRDAPGGAWGLSEAGQEALGTMFGFPWMRLTHVDNLRFVEPDDAEANEDVRVLAYTLRPNEDSACEVRLTLGKISLAPLRRVVRFEIEGREFVFRERYGGFSTEEIAEPFFENLSGDVQIASFRIEQGRVSKQYDFRWQQTPWLLDGDLYRAEEPTRLMLTDGAQVLLAAGSEFRLNEATLTLAKGRLTADLPFYSRVRFPIGPAAVQGSPLIAGRAMLTLTPERVVAEEGGASVFPVEGGSELLRLRGGIEYALEEGRLVARPERSLPAAAPVRTKERIVYEMDLNDAEATHALLQKGERTERDGRAVLVSVRDENDPRTAILELRAPPEGRLFALTPNTFLRFRYRLTGEARSGIDAYLHDRTKNLAYRMVLVFAEKDHWTTCTLPVARINGTYEGDQAPPAAGDEYDALRWEFHGQEGDLLIDRVQIVEIE